MCFSLIYHDNIGDCHWNSALYFFSLLVSFHTQDLLSNTFSHVEDDCSDKCWFCSLVFISVSKFQRCGQPPSSGLKWVGWVIVDVYVGFGLKGSWGGRAETVVWSGQ
jgi:hypothetical protein